MLDQGSSMILISSIVTILYLLFKSKQRVFLKYLIHQTFIFHTPMLKKTEKKPIYKIEKIAEKNINDN